MIECLVVLLLVGGYYAGYCAGRNNCREEQPNSPSLDRPIPMEHANGGEDDGDL